MENNTSVSEGEIRTNTQFLGLDVNLPVFSFSSGLAIIFSILVLIYPEISYELLTVSYTHLTLPTIYSV